MIGSNLLIYRVVLLIVLVTPLIAVIERLLGQKLLLFFLLHLLQVTVFFIFHFCFALKVQVLRAFDVLSIIVLFLRPIFLLLLHEIVRLMLLLTAL